MNLYSQVVEVASHNRVKWILGKSIMLFIVTNASSMLIVFTKLNDLWLYLYCAVHVGDFWRMFWIVCMRFSVQFNNLRKTWRLKKCWSRLIWGVEIHGLLKEQLKIGLYASVSCVEKNPLASPSSIQFAKSVFWNYFL